MSSHPVYQPPNSGDQPRYCDFYAFMSYADFEAWVAAGTGTSPDISLEAAA